MGRVIAFSRNRWCATVVLACLTTNAAKAQVIEITEAGQVNVRDGSGTVAWRDASAQNAVYIAGPASPSASPTTTLVLAFAGPPQMQAFITYKAQQYRLDPALLEAVIWQESRWNHRRVSPKGAIGLMQLMPATARDLGVDPYDLGQNIDGGSRYLRQMLDTFGGNVSLAVAAYNAGPRRVLAAGAIPNVRETRLYVAAIMARYGQYRQMA